MALFDPNRNKKGTGFTNINRVLNANQGNQLGNTVSNNVQNQANSVRSNVQKSQQEFEQEAEKNRLDSEENKQKRNNVIGRFETQNFKPDESKFQVSTGLQNQYNQQRTTLQQQQSQQQQNAAKERAALQSVYNQKSQELNNAQKEYDEANKFLSGYGVRTNFNDMFSGGDIYTKDGSAVNREAYEKALNTVNSLGTKYGKIQGILNPAVKSVNNLLSTFNQTTQAQEQEIANKLTNLESQYGEMTKSEKAAWIEAERDKMIAANLPTDQEIQDFAKYRTGIYNGPKTLNDFQTLLGNASEAEQVGNLTRSVGGRQELLRRFVGGNDYTQGQQRLDTMLLGQQDQGQLNQARKATRGLEENTIDANTQAANKATELSNRAKLFGEETVGKLNSVKNPVNQKINSKLAELQKQEEQRSKYLQNIQNTITGMDDKSKGLDRITRLGLGLQSAQDAGLLNQEQLNQLMGDKGLIQRAEALGLNTNALINERLKNVSAKNLNRGGAASSEQEAQLSSLDRLLGKTGTDIEFRNKGADYQRGGVGIDTESLRQYITKAEAEKMKKTPGYQAPVETPVSPIGQMVGGANQIGNAFNSMSGATGTSAMLGTDFLTGKDNFANAADGALQFGAGAYGTTAGARNTVLDGLLKLNIGGQSLNNTEAGKQISKILSYAGEIENKGLGELTKAGSNYADGLRDLTKGNKLDQALTKLTGASAVNNAVNNVGKSVSKSLFGGKTGDWHPSEYGTIDHGTGKKVQIGTFATRSSQDILKQMMSQAKNVGVGKENEGTKGLNELMSYYQNALKREQNK